MSRPGGTVRKCPANLWSFQATPLQEYQRACRDNLAPFAQGQRNQPAPFQLRPLPRLEATPGDTNTRIL